MATQKGRNWSSGDIVTAANLGSIERGVSAMAEEYTPTTWANGNTVTAAGLNNIEQGIANAGGGSSDFSTAQMTVINNTNAPVQVDAPLAIVNGEYKFAGTSTLVEPGTEILNVVLYFGEGDCTVAEGSVSVSGDAELDEGYIIVTGDCTITISQVATDK